MDYYFVEVWYVFMFGWMFMNEKWNILNFIGDGVMSLFLNFE